VVTLPHSATITNCYPVASGFTLEWIPVDELVSVVKYSTNLVTTPFTNLSSALPYPINSYTDTVHGADSECFYRVDLEDALDVGMGIQFWNPEGTCVANASGVTIYIVTPRPYTINYPEMVYSSEYWGEYPAYLPGNYADIVVLVTNNTGQIIEFTAVTSTHAMELAGSNGALLDGPDSVGFTVAAGEVDHFSAAFRLPFERKGLMRTTANLYHEGTLILTEEAIFCPPDAEVLE
jgi:hypothetical protein